MSEKQCFTFSCLCLQNFYLFLLLSDSSYFCDHYVFFFSINEEYQQFCLLVYITFCGIVCSDIFSTLQVGISGYPPPIVKHYIVHKIKFKKHTTLIPYVYYYTSVLTMEDMSGQNLFLKCLTQNLTYWTELKEKKATVSNFTFLKQPCLKTYSEVMRKR